MKKQIIISFLLLVFFSSNAFTQQTNFSVATDLDLQRSLKKEQKYWAVGQTVHIHFHFTPKNGLYTWVSYYSEGRFQNDLVATAKQTTTNPQQVNYVNAASMRFKHVSIGWKHYFKGASDIDEKWSLYSYTGFGLLLGRVINSHSVSIDTNVYAVPVRSGRANFKRLTLDVGLGWEVPIGGDIFFIRKEGYGFLRLIIQVSIFL